MKYINFIGLYFENPNWGALGRLMISKYSEYIDFAKCSENDLVDGYESECHCTVVYNNDLLIGFNEAVYTLLIKYRDLYNKLKERKELQLPKLTINTFDNEDSRVLKIDITESNLYPILKQYNSEILEEEGLEVKQYRPHLTITYLKKDTPDDVIDKIRKDIVDRDYLTYKISNFMISSKKDDTKKIPIE